MAMHFVEDKSKNIEGLKYLSALSYDISRNIVKRDKEGNIIKSRDVAGFLKTNLIDEDPRKEDSLISGLKIPLFWCLYRNRKYRSVKEVI